MNKNTRCTISFCLICTSLFFPLFSFAQDHQGSKAQQDKEFFSDSINQKISGCSDEDWQALKRITLQGEADSIDALRFPDASSYHQTQLAIAACQNNIRDTTAKVLNFLAQKLGQQQQDENATRAVTAIQILNRAEFYTSSALFDITLANASYDTSCPANPAK